jgi:protein TonB
MFETISTKRATPKRRLATVGFAAVLQVALLAGVVVTTLFAADVLPETPDMMAFVVAAPPPPPPPPPPAPPKPAEPTPEPVKATPQPVVQPAAPAEPIVAAPVEAPSAIAPETGREGEALQPFEASKEHGVEGGVIGGVSDAPPAPPPAVVRIGGSMKAPRLARRVEPEYPDVAQRANIEGLVILEATVGEDGRVDAVKLLRSQAVLDQAAIDAVKQWQYEPLIWNGRPTPFVLTVTLSFSLAAAR